MARCLCIPCKSGTNEECLVCHPVTVEGKHYPKPVTHDRKLIAEKKQRESGGKKLGQHLLVIVPIEPDGLIEE